MNNEKRDMTRVDFNIGKWLSAALEDNNVCDAMKTDINTWFDSFNERVKNEGCKNCDYLTEPMDSIHCVDCAPSNDCWMHNGIPF